jgi:ABC-2 type transport system permease protein
MEEMKGHLFSDMSVMLGRSMRHIFRSMDTIITVTLMPIAFMLLFVYVFGGAIKTGTDNYVNYLLPGILLIARSTVLWGHVLTSLVSNAISVVVIILVALIMSFRSSAGVLSWLAVAGILALFTLALIWIAAIAGLSAKSVDGASAFSYPIIFLPFISSAFVSTASMPGPVRAFAENQPVTSIVNAIRSLLARQPVGSDIWTALAWCLGILVVAYVIAMLVYKRKAS